MRNIILLFVLGMFIVLTGVLTKIMGGYGDIFITIGLIVEILAIILFIKKKIC